MIGETSVLNDRYQLDRLLGRGGFAQVFLATDRLLGRQIAVKVLDASLTEEEGFLARFAAEARAIAALDHPNILGVHDYGEAEGTAYLVMPYVAGGTLHDRLASGPPLPLSEVAALLRQIAAALDYAHQRNLVHRDIKPQNILLRAENHRALLADFGIAKVLSGAGNQTRTGLIGTLAYMAPEQFQGTVGRETDLYALGCVLYQLLTGRVPYAGTTEQVMYGHLMGAPPPLGAHPGEAAPGALQAVLDRALAKQPGERWHTAGELVLAFERAIQEGTGERDAAAGVLSPTEVAFPVSALPVQAPKAAARRFTVPVAGIAIELSGQPAAGLTARLLVAAGSGGGLYLALLVMAPLLGYPAVGLVTGLVVIAFALGFVVGHRAAG